jgi:predicted YcjX-like family ATPase
MKTTLNLKGTVHILLVDKDGNIKEDRIHENKIVNTGFAHVASRLMSNATTSMSHLAIGVSDTAVTAVQTALSSEVARQTCSSISTVQTNVDNDTVQYVANFPINVPASSVTIKEAGIFNAASGGVMLNRIVFPPVNKEPTDALSITWKVAFSVTGP